MEPSVPRTGQRAPDPGSANRFHQRRAVPLELQGSLLRAKNLIPVAKLVDDMQDPFGDAPAIGFFTPVVPVFAPHFVSLVAGLTLAEMSGLNGTDAPGGAPVDIDAEIGDEMLSGAAAIEVGPAHIGNFSDSLTGELKGGVRAVDGPGGLCEDQAQVRPMPAIHRGRVGDENPFDIGLCAENSKCLVFVG